MVEIELPLVIQSVKQSRSHLRLLLCWLLSEGRSRPSSVVPQWPQMMGGCGGQKTCKLDKMMEWKGYIQKSVQILYRGIRGTL